MVWVHVPIFDWMMEWAAGLITRLVGGDDGKSAFARVRGARDDQDYRRVL